MKVLEGTRGQRCDEAEYLLYTHKRCVACSAVKSVSLFYRRKTRTARGWAWAAYCIECSRAGCRDYGSSNKPRRNARLRSWRKKNPEAARRNDNIKRLKHDYGLTPERVNEMRISQGGRCAICDKATSRLFIDHCHTKGHVRALICPTCNTFLGWYEKKADTILKFQDYIAKHAK